MAPPTPPPPLRRAEPLVNAAGQPSPALPTSSTGETYTFLRTLPRRHRSIRDRVDKVGSHLRKWLARARSFTLPSRPTHHQQQRSHEYEDIIPRDYAKTNTPPHRRAVSADFIASSRQQDAQPGVEGAGSLGLKTSRRPSTLPHTASQASSSTPRVEEVDESPYVPESPSVYRPEQPSNSNSPNAHGAQQSTRASSSNTSPYNATSSHAPPAPGIVLSPTSDTNLPSGTPYIPDTVQHSSSLFALDEFGSSSGGTCEQTPRSGDGTVSLPEDESSLPNSRTGSSAAVALVSSSAAIATGSSAAIANGSSAAVGSTAAVGSAAVGGEPVSKHKPDLDLDSPSARPTYVNPSAPLHAMLDPTDEHLEPIVPSQLVQGTPMFKVTPKKMRQKFFRLDADQGLVTWESEKAGIIYIENIKEIRMGEEARYYREQFKQALDREDRWMTIVYTSDNKYKILHVIALSRETALLWHRTLTSLRALRRNVMSGMVSSARVWERHYWRGADMSKDERLEIEEVERLCRRLNLAIGKKDLADRFKSADKGGKGYLDFSDFQQFVKTLQARPELKRLWNRLRGEGLFDLEVFGNFLRDEQKCDLPQEQVERLFSKYASGGVERPSSPVDDSPRPSISTRPISPVFNTSPPGSRPSSPPPRRSSSVSRKTRSRSGSRTRSTAAHALGKLIGNKITHTAATPGSPTVCSYPDKSQHTIAAGLIPTTLLATPPPPHFTLDDFSTFLLSADNAAFGDAHHDMTRPLSEYYISSSHNTYLVGHQLVGESTIEGYIRALGSGCRSVEVDIWDGDYEPVITHGRTLTGSVPLRHVAHAIAKYAFVASPYPVIISAEMHAGIEQQTMVAAIFKEAFGAALVTAPIDGSTWTGPGDLEELNELPSPEMLKGRVLVKFKNALLSEVEVEVDGEVEEEEDTATTDSESVKDLGRALSLAKRVRSSFRSNKRPDPRDFSPPSMSPSNTLMLDPNAAAFVPPSLGPSSPASPTILSSVPTSPPRKKQRAYSNRSEIERPRLKMSRSLADLLIYTVGVKFRGLNKKERYGVEQMFSLSEKTANKLIKENALGLVKHCRTNLVRLYPNGTRVTSTNYEPLRYWATGVQLVAMNWQTIDLGNMMNQSMFQRNARAGYLLKPEALRGKDKELLAKRTDYVLEITIISAQQIPRRRDENGREIIKDSIMDPLVEVSLHAPDWPTAPVQERAGTGDKREGGKGTDKRPEGSKGSDKRAEGGKGSDKRGEGRGGVEKRTYRTTAVKNNGFNPVWEERVVIPFTCVADMWDLIFVRFAVLDDDDDDEPLAMHCASLGSLRKGYRHLPLHDLQFSQYLFSTLFVHVSLRQA